MCGLKQLELLRVIERALHGAVLWLCISETAALSATVGPGQNAGKAAGAPDVAKVADR